MTQLFTYLLMDSLCHAYLWLFIFCIVIEVPTFLKVRAQEGAITLKFELGQDVCTMHLSTKFHHPMINRSEVIMLTNKPTNKQTPLKTSISLRYAKPVYNH